MEKIFAEEKLGNIGGSGTGLGSAFVQDFTAAADKLEIILTSIIGAMTVAGGIWFMFQILIGGYTWLSAMGDKARLEKARDRIVNALIGLVIVVGAVAIVSLTGQFIGLNILSPATLLGNILNP